MNEMTKLTETLREVERELTERLNELNHAVSLLKRNVDSLKRVLER